MDEQMDQNEPEKEKGANGWNAAAVPWGEQPGLLPRVDAQYDPREMVALWARMAPKVDWVQGYKIARNDPLFRIIIGKVYHWGVKLLFGLRVRDTDCDFRMIRKRALDRISLESTSGTI